MRRRNFLLTVAAALSVGTIGSNPVLAMAPDPGMRSIAETVRLYQDLLAHHMSYPQDEEGITRQFDHLLGQMLREHRAGLDELTPEDVKIRFQRLRERKRPGKLSAEHLENEVRAIIPILVAKNVMATHKMAFHAHNMENWKPFVRTYGSKLPKI